MIFGNNAKLGLGLPKNTIRDADFKKFYNSLPLQLSANEIAEFSKMIQGLDSKRLSCKKEHRQKILRLKKQFKR